MVISDVNGTFLAVNDTFAKAWNKKKEDLIGVNGYQYIEEHVRESRAQKIQEMIQTKKPISFVDFHQNRWFNTTFSPILNESGKVEKLTAIIKDITNNYDLEHKYQNLIENINEGVYSLDKNGYFTFVSPIIFKYSKFSEKEFFDHRYINFFLSEDKDLIKQKFKQALQGKKVFPFEVAYHSQSKKIGYLEISAGPKYLHDTIVGVNGIVRDITKRRETEESLQKSQEMFENLAEQSPNVIFINKNERIVYTNRRAQELFEYTKEELMHPDFKFYTFLDDASKQKAKNAFEKHQQGIEVPPLEYTILSKSGRPREVLITTKLIDYDNSQAILGIITDISRQKQIERQIIKALNQLHRIVNNTSELIFTIDSNFIMKSWNHTAIRVVGYKRNEIVGKQIKQLNLFVNPLDVIEKTKEKLQGKKVQMNELEINTKHGSRIILQVSTSFIQDEQDKEKELLFICKDVTKEREMLASFQFGNGYLIFEKKQQKAFESFHQFLYKGYHGLYIGRIIDDARVLSMQSSKIHIVHVSSEADKKYKTVGTLDDLYKVIKLFITSHEKTLVYIDRLDYFISLYSFEQLLTTLYKIHNLVQMRSSLLFLRFNERILSNTQKALLEEEFQKSPADQILQIQLSPELQKILEFIDQENMSNRAVSYSSVGQKFSISKATIKKKITQLRNDDLVYQQKKGRSKLLYVSEKGKRLVAMNT